MRRLGSPHRVTTAPVKVFALTGELASPAALSVADLREGWPGQQADVVFDCATSGSRRHTFSGPLLRDVLTEAGPLFDARSRKDRSRFLVAIEGGDGHRAVLSWAEIDSDFGDAPVLLATAMDGSGLDLAGSQLVVPSDRCGARYVSAISNVWVGAPASFPHGAGTERSPAGRPG